ncbi:MAG: hypothetical protein JO044_10035 [Mycobacteriaceae bacterium]|nr:hypothetical protein [Mycobacteriaceae bacterium]MBV9639590.1 hypothetical protein [Mycobacteriaceae bacterium]
MTADDMRRAREALAAARDLSRTADARSGARGPSMGQRFPQSTRAIALAAEQFARIGLDPAKLEPELAAQRAEDDRRLKEIKADAVAQSAARAASLRRLTDAERSALEGLAATTGNGSGTQYFALDSPVEIWATDGVAIESSTIEPYNSRAKIRRDDSIYRSVDEAILSGVTKFLHFYYLWENPRQDAYVSVNVNALLTLNGFCSAHSRGAVFPGGKAKLSLAPTLDLVQTWTVPISSAAPQSGASQTAVDITADSEGVFTHDQTVYAVEFRGFALSYDQEIVPPGQNLIIDVALSIYDDVDNGEVSADFATGEFYVLSPLVQLAILASRSDTA